MGIDYKSLPFEARVGIEARVCGKCGELMAVTTTCPLREKRTVTVKEGFKKVKKKISPTVCWHCCAYKCAYSVDTPQGKRCGIKLNIRKKSGEACRRQKDEKGIEATFGGVRIRIFQFEF